MKYDKMILGENCAFSMDSNETGLNNNIVVCGASGCGKTMSILEPRLLEAYNSSLIITLSKRRILKQYSRLLKSRGYKILDLNFVTPKESQIAYDPLEYVASYEDIDFLANSIVMSNPKKETTTADPFWDDGAISLLSAEIAYILMSKDNPSFPDVLDLHNSIDFSDESALIKTSLDLQFEYLEENDPNCFAVRCWQSFKKLPIKTAGCLFSSLNTILDTLFTPELREMMRLKNKVNFEELANEKTILFVSTSPVNPALHSFINIFYAQIFKQLFELGEAYDDGCLPIPVQLLCDDFAVGGTINNFEEYISIFREKRISVTMLLQSEAQLEAIYGRNAAATILDNCDTYVFMGTNSLSTAQNISQRLNKPVEDILYGIPQGKIVVFRRQNRPVITNRYNTLDNEIYREMIMKKDHSGKTILLRE